MGGSPFRRGGCGGGGAGGGGGGVGGGGGGGGGCGGWWRRASWLVLRSAAAVAGPAARVAVGLVCGGEVQVDQRGVHDGGNSRAGPVSVPGGWHGSCRRGPRRSWCGPRPANGG